ncbi:lipid-A-disaccharide synthase [Rhodobacteraceae bacterium NNCM2]|nr:lipid-A-disaccharide synthase [Coraliihabitans acroporae]
MSRRLYLIAGEPSGDRLGAELMRSLKAEDPGIEFMGLGGREMTAAGLKSLFDISELSVMGLTEVIAHMPSLMRRLSQVTEDVLSKRPDALITIDSPSFSLRVAERVRKSAPEIRTIHYVAPSVWAWRPGRAKHMARFIDHVLALLPFEPPYMEAAGMTCDFVGHPVAARKLPDPAEIEAIRTRWTGGVEAPCLLVAPGSRRGEVRRLMPLFQDVIWRLTESGHDVIPVIPVAETVIGQVQASISSWPVKPQLILPDEGEAAKLVAFAAADAALVASGTITLEMAAARTPMVACYRTSWLTAAIVRRIVKVNTANLINLVADEAVVPEFLQEFATVDAISAALIPLLKDSAEKSRQIETFDRVMNILGGGEDGPPQLAARSVLGQLPA